MERAPGVPVFKIWVEMSPPRKLELIKQFNKFERELSSIQLPAYGSLYLRAFSRNIPGYKLLGSDADPSASYCVGRSGDRSFIMDGCQEWDGSKLDPGPWTTLSAYGIAIAKREMFRISGDSSPHPGTFYQGSSLEQTNLLESTIRLLSYWIRILFSHNPLSRSFGIQTFIWETFMCPLMNHHKLFRSLTGNQYQSFHYFCKHDGLFSSSHHKIMLEDFKSRSFLTISTGWTGRSSNWRGMSSNMP
ncbi:phosphotransferase enzyme family protein [Histoplasma capsulatum var. duboisii H88]|uniref:Phosphotransferase enzyme family protein n=1 Tax=Ajellomyces capsulatus (strain H88) TaxID=544711 RepID=A0A8A1LE78_AJEC8|nr:phosphotransferase enzyme family protein [Histoplasma capsulatum var. duboisii H88]